MELKTIIQRIGRDTSGGNAIEYGLIVSLVVIACMGAFESVANENTGLWATVSNKTSEAMD